MKKCVAVLISIFAIASPGFAAEGPFGVPMGTAIGDLKSCTKDDDFFYLCDSLPRAHSAFVKYAVEVSEGTGVCAIIGLGKEVLTGSNGFDLSSTIDNIADQLKGKYGAGTKYDYLQTGSIWNRSQDWTMGVNKQERVYAYTWQPKKNEKLKDNVKGISLQANVRDLNHGSFTLKYFFENHDRCKEARKAAEKGAL